MLDILNDNEFTQDNKLLQLRVIQDHVHYCDTFTTFEIIDEYVFCSLFVLIRTDKGRFILKIILYLALKI